ncbi:MAG: IclR family transcriptional regulator [Myxococcota bacterium]|nr:IclR family transcriptional regulator [Myxococcota bacterium]
MMKPKSDYVIQTVQNAMRLLESFQDDIELGVSELSRRLGLHKNNVFRLLATLEQSGHIEQSAATDRYRLGPRCLELGRSFARGSRLLERARPLLSDLANDLGESAHLGVMHNFEVVHLDGEQPRQLVLASSRVGGRMPVHSSALGKVLIGNADEATRTDYDTQVVARGLEARTDGTITDRDKLFEHLRTVAVQGFALDIDEYELGLRCAAAPVFDAEGRCVAGLSVSGPAPRMSEDRLHCEVVEVLTGSADRLSAQLGRS